MLSAGPTYFANIWRTGPWNLAQLENLTFFFQAREQTQHNRRKIQGDNATKQDECRECSIISGWFEILSSSILMINYQVINLSVDYEMFIKC